MKVYGDHQDTNINNKELITVGGSVSTGSTPLIDLLKEYNELFVVNGEFRPGKYLFDAVSQLYKGEHIGQEQIQESRKKTLNYGNSTFFLADMYFKCLIHMPKSITHKKKDNIAELTQRRMEQRGYEKRVPGFKKFTKTLFDKLEDLDHRQGSLNDDERFLELSEYMEEYFRSVSRLFVQRNPGRTPVYDQMINPNKLFSDPGQLILAKLLPSARIIVVSRDVRDQYCDMTRKKKKGYHLMRPEERVERYIQEYTKRYTDMHDLLKNRPANILHIRFEDLIFHYDNTKQEVERFLGIKDHHRPQNYFDPTVAVRNTRLFRDIGKNEEIAKIERNMSQWLYPFDENTELKAG